MPADVDEKRTEPDYEPDDEDVPLRPGFSVSAAAGIGVLVLALIGVIAYLVFFRPAPSIEPVTEARPVVEDAAATEIVVYVTGAVAAPQVVTLPAGARLQEAIDAAGGFEEDADIAAVNLAREAVDGEQIVVPVLGEGGAAEVGADGPSGIGGDGRVNINTADEQQLQELPGVGPSTAANIVAHREQNGPFASVDDLQDVSGIGPKKLEALRDAATV